MYPHDLSDYRNLDSRIAFYELKDELLEIQSQYESLLMDSTKLPHSGISNTPYFQKKQMLMLGY
jgi:hypothetical protein